MRYQPSVRSRWLDIGQVHFTFNHNYNKILESDCLSTVLISALMGQCNRTVHATARVLLNGLFFTDRKKPLGSSCV